MRQVNGWLKSPLGCSLTIQFRRKDMYFEVLLSVVLIVCISIWLFKAFGGKSAEENKPKDSLDDYHSQIEYVFFTDLESENIMFIASRKSHIRTVIDIKGHKLDQNGDIIPILDANGNIDLSQPPKTLLRNWLGLWWVGLPMFRQKYAFDIIKERVNPKISSETEPEEWVIQDKKPAHIYELRWKFPRPVFVPNVEFDGNVQANILVLANFQVRNPYRAVFTQNARFFELIKSYIETAVNAYCNHRSFNEFRLADKQLKDGKKHYTAMADPQGFSQFIMDNVNEVLEREVGICITGATVTRYDSSTQVLQDALQAEALAELRKKKALVEAEENYQVTIRKAQADSEADRLRAKNIVEDIKETMATLIEKGVDPNIAAQMAATIGESQRISGMTNLTTYVKGGGANIAIPIKEKP